jgi:hypothetical protein
MLIGTCQLATGCEMKAWTMRRNANSGIRNLFTFAAGRVYLIGLASILLVGSVDIQQAFAYSVRLTMEPTSETGLPVALVQRIKINVLVDAQVALGKIFFHKHLGKTILGSDLYAVQVQTNSSCDPERRCRTFLIDKSGRVFVETLSFLDFEYEGDGEGDGYIVFSQGCGKDNLEVLLRSITVSIEFSELVSPKCAGK